MTNDWQLCWHLQIYDGLLDSDPIIGRYCTSDAFPTKTTTGPYARLSFHSDRSMSDSGFDIRYHFSEGRKKIIGTWWRVRVRSTLESAWILTLVLKSAWIWSELWKLHKILEKCLNYSIPSLNFYPRPVLAFGYCRCLRLCVCVSVCMCVNHLLVRAITRDPFKLGSPNLDQRCKRPWLRSLLFWGAIDLDLQGQI